MTDKTIDQIVGDALVKARCDKGYSIDRLRADTVQAVRQYADKVRGVAGDEWLEELQCILDGPRDAMAFRMNVIKHARQRIQPAERANGAPVPKLTSAMIEAGSIRKWEWDACESIQDIYALFRKQWERALAAAPTQSTQRYLPPLPEADSGGKYSGPVLVAYAHDVLTANRPATQSTQQPDDDRFEDRFIAKYGNRLAEMLHIDGYDIADRDARILEALKSTQQPEVLPIPPHTFGPSRNMTEDECRWVSSALKSDVTQQPDAGEPGPGHHERYVAGWYAALKQVRMGMPVPAPQVAQTADERRSDAAFDYFARRPRTLRTNENQRIFEAGFDRGYESAPPHSPIAESAEPVRLPFLQLRVGNAYTNEEVKSYAREAICSDRAALSRQSAAPNANSLRLWHVAYFDEGKFEWMSGIRPFNCELYTMPAAQPHSPIADSGDLPEFPPGYCTDPNGAIIAPKSAHEHFHFGYDIGFREAWQIMNKAIKQRAALAAQPKADSGVAG